ncbi:MAG: hypothetical protein ACSHYA_09445 [Opitutaceae bacterium]
MGNNLPGESVNDGDFTAMKENWRRPEQSSYWTSHFKGGYKAGFADTLLTGGGSKEAYFDTVDLTKISDYKELIAGDVLSWKFATKAQYPCDPRLMFSLKFGDHERVLVEEQAVPAGNVDFKVFEGTYVITEEDAEARDLKAHFALFERHAINVYVDYLDLKILRDETAGPRKLKVKAADAGLHLTWSGRASVSYNVYRSSAERSGYQRIAENVRGSDYTDTTIINGTTNYYFVTEVRASESTASPIVGATKFDKVAPQAPHTVKAVGQDFLVKLNWSATDNDIESYNVFRNKTGSQEMELIAPHVENPSYVDNLPHKGEQNIYEIQAVDFSGNISMRSKPVTARVKTVPGASFSDLILPMPIHKELRFDLWGADTVLPRSADNGVEDTNWSYWGGKVVKDTSDGRYHILVVRWPEGHRKGHWAWPESTVAHAISEFPAGPYEIIKDLAYDYKAGLGHNTNIIPLNDGRYAMYSLINFVPTIFTADTMLGPWKFEGVMDIETNTPLAPKGQEYLFRNNLTGVQCEDGSFLFISKRGASMRSTAGILGPYKVLTKEVIHNPTIPRELRTGCEDPGFWYDGVQYHMLINFHMSYRGIYLRSPDGVNWKYETGIAFTPLSTTYEDGTRTLWYKVERPNVLQDEYGRGTHLSLAAMDVVKREDFGNDKHSSKHVILPLVVYKRIEMLNDEPVTAQTKSIKILIRSEPGFDAQTDIDVDSLRLGASEEVNYGRGCKVIDQQRHKDGLLVEFDGEGNGITEKNFTCKLIGRSTAGELIVGYTRLSAK